MPVPLRLAASSLLSCLLAAGLASAQVPEPGDRGAGDVDVDERAVVVVRDLFVEGRVGRLEDLTVTLDGERAPVVGLSESDDEPVDTLIVLDGALGDTTELRRAALLVAGLAEQLASLGSVRVVVLRGDDTEERLAWTGNAERLERTLSRLGVEGTSDEILSTLRLPWTAAEALGEDPPADQAEPAARESTLAIVRQIDRLVELAAEPTRTARRVMLLAAGGFDPCPAAAFGVEEIAPELTGCRDADPQGPGLGLGPTLATLGWTVAAVLPPKPEDARAWRFGTLDRIEDPTPANPDSGGPALFGVTIKINQERKPKRARAYLEQAQAHLDQGEVDDAEEAAHKAIHHFADGRKTRSEEADAWRLVAAIHARRGEASETSRSLLRAQRLDPRQRGDAGVSARLADAYRAARRPLERAAEATGGAAVYSASELTNAMQRLAARPRLTYQFPEAVSPELLRLEARSDGRLLEAPPWSSPSPSRLTSLAAARTLLRGAGSIGPRRPAFEVFLPDAPEETAGPLTLYLELSTVVPDLRRWSEGPWRVTLLHSELDAEQRHVDPPRREPGSERFALEVEPDRRAPIELVLVEDLATGVWGYATR